MRFAYLAILTAPPVATGRPARSGLVAVIRIDLFVTRAHIFFRCLDVGLGLIADPKRRIGDDAAVNRQRAGPDREHRVRRNVAGGENYREPGQNRAEPAPETLALPKRFFHFFTIYVDLARCPLNAVNRMSGTRGAAIL